MYRIKCLWRTVSVSSYLQLLKEWVYFWKKKLHHWLITATWLLSHCDSSVANRQPHCFHKGSFSSEPHAESLYCPLSAVKQGRFFGSGETFVTLFLSLPASSTPQVRCPINSIMTTADRRPYNRAGSKVVSGGTKDLLPAGCHNSWQRNYGARAIKKFRPGDWGAIIIGHIKTFDVAQIISGNWCPRINFAPGQETGEKVKEI